MNEDLYFSAVYQLCEQLVVIRKERLWERDHVDFFAYAKKRLGLSKTRTRLLLNFAHFAAMCREARTKLPDSPECVQAVLSLPKKSWLDAWTYCVDCAEGPITYDHCVATLERFGFVRNKKLPRNVLDAMAAKRAEKALAAIEDVENVKRTGTEWDKAIYNAIEIDQRTRNG